MEESEVHEAVVKWLLNKGYTVPKKYLEKYNKEVDIKAYKDGDQFIVECKGDTSSPRTDFQTAIGQIIMRMDPSFDTNFYAIALPDNKKYRRLIDEIPKRVRKLLHLRFLTTSFQGDVKEVR